MGKCLSRKPYSPPDTKIILSLKTHSIDDINDCVNILNIDFCDLNCLSYI